MAIKKALVLQSNDSLMAVTDGPHGVAYTVHPAVEGGSGEHKCTGTH